VVDRAWKRLGRHAAAISESSAPEDLHRVRIDAKKLRYLLELLQPFYPEIALDPGIARLRKLQDCLGRFHDAWVEQQALRSLAMRAGGETGDASRLLLHGAGRLIERAAATAAQERREFSRRFEGVMKGASRRCVDALIDAA
jgi:CHAD domain-containing protein